MKCNVLDPHSHSLSESFPDILIGLDWGDTKHAYAIEMQDGSVETGFADHECEVLHVWLEALQKRFNSQPVSIVLETGSVPLIAALREYHWIRIYAICPLASAAYRKSFRPSGAKDDQPDAKLLLQMLRAHHDALTPLADLGTDQTRLLDKVVLHRRRLIDQRTALANKLRAALKSYFPQALKVMPEELSRPFVALFLRKFPNLLDVKKARPSIIKKLFQQGGVSKQQNDRGKGRIPQTGASLAQGSAVDRNSRTSCETSS